MASLPHLRPFPVGMFDRSGVYVGPGDQVAGVSRAFGLRAYAAVAANGSTKALNIRPGSGSANYDVLLLKTGALDIAGAIATAGVDATGLGAITGTTLTFTGGHQGDSVSGGTVLPGTFIVSGASPTWTVNKSQTVASATLTLTWGMFIAKVYDQTGASDAVQATTSLQPLLVPRGGPNGVLPAMWFNGSNNNVPSSITAVTQTVSWVANSNNGVGSVGPVFAVGGTTSGHYNGGNAFLFAGSIQTASATNGVYHSVGGVYNGAASIINVDGTSTTVNPGTSGTVAETIGADPGSGQFFNNFICEIFVWSTVKMTIPQLNTINTNKHAYWGF